MNLTQQIRNRVLVEWRGYAFFVDFEYESLLDYCTHCKCTRYYVEICKRIKEQNKDMPQKDQVHPKVNVVVPWQDWKAKKLVARNVEATAPKLNNVKHYSYPFGYK